MLKASYIVVLTGKVRVREDGPLEKVAEEEQDSHHHESEIDHYQVINYHYYLQ